MILPLLRPTMRRGRRAAFIAGLLSAAIPASGEVSVEAFLESVWEENPRLQARSLEGDSARSAERAAGRWADPMVGVELFPQGGMADYRVMVQQTLPRAGELRSAREQAQARAEGTEWAKTGDRWLVAEQALTALAAVVEEKEREAVLQETVNLVEEILKAARQQVGTGTISQVQVLQWENELRSLQRQLASSQEKQASLRQRLAYWQGGEGVSGEGFTLPALVEGFRVPEARAAEEVEEPVAGTLRSRIREAEAAEAGVRSSGRPQFGLGLEYARMPSAEEDEIMAVGTVSIPLWRDSLRAETRSYALQRSAWERRLRDREREWQTEWAEIRFAWEDLEAEVRLLEDELVPRAEEILKQTRSAYLSGQVGYADILLAQRSLLDWSLALVETRRQQVETAARWQRLAAELQWN
ncbi:MAG: TolC family protein [Opitutales bacterium]|nr:TolC family protein [Opitutales bacterium]